MKLVVKTTSRIKYYTELRGRSLVDMFINNDENEILKNIVERLISRSPLWRYWITVRNHSAGLHGYRDYHKTR